MDSLGQKQEKSQDASLMPCPFASWLLAAFVLVAGAAKSRAEEPSVITATDLFNIRQVETPAISPDGRWVVYVVRSIEPKTGTTDDGNYRTQLWLAAVDGTTPPRPLTFGIARNSSPVWSPSGDRIAFVRTAEKEKPQVYLLPFTGGEALPLTQFETGATSPRWSPDGKQILFTSSLSYAEVRAGLEKLNKNSAPDWGTEKPGRKVNDTANWAFKPKAKPGETESPKPAAKPDGTLAEIREWLARDEADATPRVFDRLNFLVESDLEVEKDFDQFYVIDAQENASPKGITLGYEAFTAAEWLADAKSLVCLGPRKPTAHPDRSGQTNSVFVVDIATGTSRVLLAEPGNAYGNPKPSPDGKWIAYGLTTGGEFSFDQAMVAIVPVRGGPVEILTPRLDRNVANLTWSPNSQWIYFTAPDRGRFPLFRVGLAQREPENLTTATDWGINSFSVGPDSLVEVVTNPRNPWELYAAAPDGKSPHALTTHNRTWLQNRKLSAYEPHRLENREGITVDYWTVKPANFDPAKKYPLLVEIHGGPSAMWGPGEPTTWHEMQFFAARGYAIVFCNPRGSGGYGRDFLRANYRDWGTGPTNDVLAAAGFAANESYIDKERQVLTGGSYGGYLTAWIVGHDHRFKAAVAQRGVYDLATFYGEGNAWPLVPLYWGGYPWQPEVRAILNRDSPLTYVENITTPLLIEHGDQDYRTGFVQSEILYKSLKQLGREVEYVRYPRATHELSRSGEPKEQLDRLVRYEEFFRRYIGEN